MTKPLSSPSAAPAGEPMNQFVHLESGDAVPRTPEPDAELDEMVRDFCKVGLRIKSEVRARIVAYASSVTAQLREKLALMTVSANEENDNYREAMHRLAERDQEIAALRKAAEHLLEWVPTCSVGSSGYQRIEALKTALRRTQEGGGKP